MQGLQAVEAVRAANNAAEKGSCAAKSPDEECDISNLFDD